MGEEKKGKKRFFLWAMLVAIGAAVGRRELLPLALLQVLRAATTEHRHDGS